MDAVKKAKKDRNAITQEKEDKSVFHIMKQLFSNHMYNFINFAGCAEGTKVIVLRKRFDAAFLVQLMSAI